MAISERSVINAPDFEVDPRLMLPAGIVNSGYIQLPEDDNAFQGDPGNSISGSSLTVTEISSDQISYGIPVPDSISIVSQTIRIVPGGGIVVDVEVDVTSSAGADLFEARLSKL